MLQLLDCVKGWYQTQLFLLDVFVFGQSNDVDLSTAESGSDVDDCFSPRGSSVYRHPKLTPVHEEVWL